MGDKVRGMGTHGNGLFVKNIGQSGGGNWNYGFIYDGEVKNKIVNGWLNLYASPTVAAAPERIIDLEKDEQGDPRPKPALWAATEPKSPLDYQPRADEIASQTQKPVVVNYGVYNERIDENGRYWLAVGPKVIYENYLNNCPSNGAGLPSDFNWNVKIDVVVQDNATGAIYYIPCVPGDIKAHTWDNGIYQTGLAYPNGGDPKLDNDDPSAVEFMAPKEIPNANAFQNTFNSKYKTAYRAIKMIVYNN